MTDNIEREWSLALGKEVEIFPVGDALVLHVGGVFHGLFTSLEEVEWELDAIYTGEEKK